MQRYDLIIVGGGLVGLSVAVALADTSLKIALIDARKLQVADPRLYALNYSSCQFLKNIGIWTHLVANAAPIHEVQVSHQGHFGSLNLHHGDVSLPELGFVIPARIIETAMNDELIRHADVFSLYRPAKLKTLKEQKEGVELSIENESGEQQLFARFVIGADGTESTVRQLLNIPTEIIDYEQSAIVTHTLLKRFHENVAHERFNDDGAIAMLPLIANECATIITGNNVAMTKWMAKSSQEFVDDLQNQFGYRLGRLQKVGERHTFPLRMVRVKKPFTENVYLLGNAAHTLHPIAAQGLNLALYEVALFVARCKEKFPLDLQSLYEQTQKQQARSIGLSHRLSHLFHNKSTFFDFSLQLGMLSLEALTPIKKQFLRNIMGRKGHLPNLLLSSQ